MTAALELNRRSWRVEVIDPGPVPRPTAASTDISKVVRMDYGADELYTVMSEAALTGWDRWNARWGAPLYHEDGFLLLTGQPMQPGGFEYESFTLLGHRGHPVERLGGGVPSPRFPGWSPHKYPDGYFSRRAGWAESGKVTARLAAEAQAQAIPLGEGTAFDRLLENGARVAGVKTKDGRDLRADVVLVAAGAWTPTLLPHLRNVMRAIGQPVAHFRVENPLDWQSPRFPVWAADISRTGWYGFPSLADGTLKIGRHGSGRPVSPDEPRTVQPGEAVRFREFLLENLPGLAKAPLIDTHLCLYCDTFDGDFWIDHDPDRPGLIVAAGDSGHGFKFAPILGELIADIVERVPNPWAARFAWRGRGDERKEAARALLA